MDIKTTTTTTTKKHTKTKTKKPSQVERTNWWFPARERAEGRGKKQVED